MLLTTRLGLVRHTVPVTGDGGGGVSGSGKVTKGSGLAPPLTLPSTRSSSSIELRKRLKFIGFDKFFISEILDFSSERSDFIDEAFISLEDVTWCTLCEDDDDDDDVEQEDLATRELEVEDVLLDCSIWGTKTTTFITLPIFILPSYFHKPYSLFWNDSNSIRPHI
jgi:hypothetical protein